MIDDYELSYDEQCLLKLVSAALTDNNSVSFEKTPDWKIVLKLAKGHAVCSLLYDLLAVSDDLPAECKKMLADESRKTVLQSYRLLFLSRSIIDLLEEIDIQSLILKGSCVSALYPIPELRKSGDVDIYILKPECIDEACRKLEECGFTVDAEQHSSHHVAMKSPDNIQIELHTMFAEPFDSKRINQHINKAAEQCVKSVVIEDVMGVPLPRLSDAYQAYSLLLHMLQHFLRAGFGLKLLCDWVTFWNHAHDKETETLYLTLINECGIKRFSDIVTATCVRFLGLKHENVLFMLDDGYCELQEEYTKAFIREVLDAKEFGKSEKERMVALRGTSIFDYFREFHYQTCLNFPNASKGFILWPALWTITLCRFLKNNRKLRGVSTRSVLKNAKERGKLIKDLKLFEKWQ